MVFPKKSIQNSIHIPHSQKEKPPLPTPMKMFQKKLPFPFPFPNVLICLIPLTCLSIHIRFPDPISNFVVPSFERWCSGYIVVCICTLRAPSVMKKIPRLSPLILFHGPFALCVGFVLSFAGPSLGGGFRLPPFLFLGFSATPTPPIYAWQLNNKSRFLIKRRLPLKNHWQPPLFAQTPPLNRRQNLCFLSYLPHEKRFGIFPYAKGADELEEGG